MLRPAAAVTPTAASFAEPTVRPALAPTAARIVPAVNRSVASTPRVVPVAASTSSQCGQWSRLAHRQARCHRRTRRCRSRRRSWGHRQRRKRRGQGRADRRPHRRRHRRRLRLRNDPRQSRAHRRGRLGPRAGHRDRPSAPRGQRRHHGVSHSL